MLLWMPEPSPERLEHLNASLLLRCEFDEFVGGFDGVPSNKLKSGHSLGVDSAVAQMFHGTLSEQNSFIEVRCSVLVL